MYLWGGGGEREGRFEKLKPDGALKKSELQLRLVPPERELSEVSV